MTSRIEQIIEEIEEYIDGCNFQPLSKKNIVVNKEEIEELLRELRMKTPEEIKKYKGMLSRRDMILQDAQDKADAMLAEAQEKSEEMIRQATLQKDELLSEQEIMVQAYNAANAVVESTEAQAQKMLDETAAKAQKMLDDAAAEAQMRLDNAFKQSNDYAMSAAAYADELLGNMQTMIKHTMETHNSRFQAMIGTLNNFYQQLEENRQEIAATIAEEVSEDQAEEAVEE